MLYSVIFAVFELSSFEQNSRRQFSRFELDELLKTDLQCFRIRDNFTTHGVKFSQNLNFKKYNPLQKVIFILEFESL